MKSEYAFNFQEQPPSNDNSFLHNYKQQTPMNLQSNATSSRLKNTGAMIMNSQYKPPNSYMSNQQDLPKYQSQNASGYADYQQDLDYTDQGNFSNLMKMINPQQIKIIPNRRFQHNSISARISPLRGSEVADQQNQIADQVKKIEGMNIQSKEMENVHKMITQDKKQIPSPYLMKSKVQQIDNERNSDKYLGSPIRNDGISLDQSSVRVISEMSQRPSQYNSRQNRPQMGSQKNSPKQLNTLKAETVYDPSEEAYDIGHLNKQLLDDGEDAGGAILKKLYRIHSRYILEVNDSLPMDISGQLVDLNQKRKGKTQARPLDDVREYNQKKKMVDPNNNLLSLFLNKNNITDFEAVLEKEMDKLNNSNYEEKCFLVKQCFQENPNKKVQKKKVIEVSVMHLMKYHDFFCKISSQAVKQMLKSFCLVRLSQEQLLFKEMDTQLSFYFVLFGKVVMHSKQLGAIAMVKMGDFIGEELVFEKGDKNIRNESAYSEGDTFLLECQLDDWRKFKDILVLMGLKKDFLNIENQLKKCYQQKKVRRSHKSKITGEHYNID